MQVHQVCPQTLLPVLPRLAEELHADDAKRRSAATSLVGSLFSLQGSDLTSSYADLFDALLKRLEDREVGSCPSCWPKLLTITKAFFFHAEATQSLFICIDQGSETVSIDA